MSDAYSENEALCRENDEAAAKRGKKTRHRVRCKGNLTEAPIWVRRGRCARIEAAPGYAVHVVEVHARGDGDHAEALLRLHRLTKAAG